MYMCLYINSKWCVNYTVKSTFCSPLLELMVVNCRPFYLPREITCVRFVVVYIPQCPSSEAGRQTITEKIWNTVSECQDDKPDAAVLVVGDFNGCHLDKDLAQFYQYVQCKTRSDATLDLCYCNFEGAYKACKLAPLGKSDHNNIYLIPKYKQLIKRENPTVVNVKRMDENSMERLRGSLASTDWSVFREACNDDLSVFTETVTDYIMFCQESCTESKQIKVYPNNKPWISKDLRESLIDKNKVAKAGDREALKAKRVDLNS